MKLLSNSDCSEVTVVVRADISSWVTIPKTSGGTKTTREHVGECEENSSSVMIVITFEGAHRQRLIIIGFQRKQDLNGDCWRARGSRHQLPECLCLTAIWHPVWQVVIRRTRWPIATGPSQLTDKQLPSGRCCWCWCLHITLYSFGKLLFSNKEGQASISGQWQCHFTVALDMFKWLMTCDEWHKCQPLTPKSGTFQQPL